MSISVHSLLLLHIPSYNDALPHCFIKHGVVRVSKFVQTFTCLLCVMCSVDIPTVEARSCLRFQAVPSGTGQAIVVSAVAEGSSPEEVGKPTSSVKVAGSTLCNAQCKINRCLMPYVRMCRTALVQMVQVGVWHGMQQAECRRLAGQHDVCHNVLLTCGITCYSAGWRAPWHEAGGHQRPHQGVRSVGPAGEKSRPCCSSVSSGNSTSAGHNQTSA